MDKSIARDRCSQAGWVLLIYYFLMSASVSLIGIFAPEQGIYDGWGYLLAAAIAFVVVIHWQRPKFPFKEFWKRNRQILPTNAVLILCAAVSCQVFFQLLCALWESAFGTQVIDSMAQVATAQRDVGMLLYIGIAAPVFEEILFRGFVMRVLRPYGKCFAIMASAFLFGIFHEHILQSPFAFAMGLILGYTAVEFSLKWAIAVHMINNLVLGIGFTYLSDWIGPEIANWIYTALIYGCALIAVTMVFCKCSALLKYWRESDRQKFSLRCFLTAPGILLLTALMVGSIALSIFAI
jgi:membrane protease YdiL (CAAX protease family)